MAAKRANGEGSAAYQRCRKCSKKFVKSKCPECGGRNGIWVAVVSLGWRQEGDKKVRVRQAVYGETQDEAIENRDKLKANPPSPTQPKEAKFVTVRTYLERWLKDAVAHRVRPRTFHNYRTHIDRHILPAIGDLPLKKLGPAQVQALYTPLLEQGKLRTAYMLHQILNPALKRAVMWEYIAKNPCESVEKPKYRMPEERKTLSLDQVTRVVTYLEGDEWFAFFYLAIATGLRRAELCGLRWQDVDLQAGALSVRQAAEQVKTVVIYTDPKTKKGRRTIPLPDEAGSVLKEHRRRQLEERLTAGPLWQDKDLIFCNGDGSSLKPDKATDKWRDFKKEMGVQVTLHDLRHTYATLLRAAGEDIRSIQLLLGHSSHHFTAEVYTHTTQEMDQRLLAKLNAIMPKTRATNKVK